MDHAPAKRRGRPRKNEDNSTGRQSFHLGLRLGDDLRDALLRVVAHANEVARTHGLPATVTPSALVGLWVVERIRVEDAKLAKASRK